MATEHNLTIHCKEFTWFNTRHSKETEAAITILEQYFIRNFRRRTSDPKLSKLSRIDMFAFTQTIELKFAQHPSLFTVQITRHPVNLMYHGLRILHFQRKA